MHNILLFIRRYFNFIFFLVMQVFCLFMLFKYNKYHNAVFMGFANEFSGRVNQQYNRVDYYLHLKKTNDSLMLANERLYNKLRENFNIPDTLTTEVIDTIRVDSLEKHRMFLYKTAKVVANSVYMPNNYIELHRGSNQGVIKDLGVIDQNSAVVGTVIDVSNNFSVVMSILHQQSTISAKHKSSGSPGSIYWDGNDPRYVLLKEISKSAKVKIGDSIVTSGFTTRFPYGLLIGYVSEIIPDKSSNNYLLKIKTAADLANIQHVFIIENLQKQEMEELLNRAKKTNE